MKRKACSTNIHRAIVVIIYTITSLSLLQNKPLVSTPSLPDLIFVQIPQQATRDSLNDNNAYSPRDKYVEGARIVLLKSAASTPINLTPEFAAACDPNVSFDGKSIIFSGKKNPVDSWQIWRMNQDGSNKTQITHEKGDCFAPVHAGNRFYLNDPQPTPQIIFSGTVYGRKNQDDMHSVLSLYGTDHEGTTIHRLTFNLHSDFSPDVLPDGRIVFTSRQQFGNRYQPHGINAFMGINNDGTDLMALYGNHETPIYKDMLHVSRYDERIYFIESEIVEWLGGGDIAFVSQRRPLHSYQKLSIDKNGLYHSPCALPENALIASFRSNSSDDVFGIYQINFKSGKRQKRVFKDVQWHSIDAQVLLPRPNVKGRSNWLIPGATTGVFYCLNAYRTDIPEFADMAPGTIKYVRVIEGLPQEWKDATSETSIDETSLQNTDRDTFSPQRILGVAPVEDDGSFHIRVPAEIPVTFQLLDESHIAQQSQQAWTWVMGNENRGCIGCHENRELSPPNKMVKAITKKPVELTQPPEQRRTVDFRNQIALTVKSKCLTCHTADKSTLNVKQADHDVYQLFVESIDGRQNGRYVIPGKAKDSPLVWQLLGKNPALTNILYTGEISTVHSKINEEVRMLFIEWIDLGAHWNLE